MAYLKDFTGINLKYSEPISRDPKVPFMLAVAVER